MASTPATSNRYLNPPYIPGTGEPHLGSLQLEQRLQFRQAQRVLFNELTRAAANHLVEVFLDLEKHPRWDDALVFRCEQLDEMSMSLALGHVNGPLTARLLKRSPGAHSDQPFYDFYGGTTVSGLV